MPPKVSFLPALFALASLQPSAHADWYAGVEVSSNTINADDPYRLFEDKEFDERDTGFGLYVGYRFSDHFSAQLGYVDFGSFDDQLFSAESGNEEALEMELDAWTASVKGELPITSNFSAFGEIGAFHWSLDTSGYSILGLAANPFPPPPPAIRSGSSTDVFLGIGARYHMNEHWSALVSYEYFDLERDSSDINIDSVALALEYSFDF